MSSPWGGMPLLPLRCILDYLSLEDAMSAMSTCRHWHCAIMLYHGRRDTVKLFLRPKDYQKNMFLTRIMKRFTKNLQIYIDCTAMEFEKYLIIIVAQFFDSTSLEEIVFVGPGYVTQKNYSLSVEIKRVIYESLVLKHLHTLKKISLIGCQVSMAYNESDRFINKNVEHFSNPLVLCEILSPADTILCKSNINLMAFTTINHIILDYDYATTDALVTLSQLTRFTILSLNVCNKTGSFKPIDWFKLLTYYREPLKVFVNIIELPYARFKEVINKVLVEGLQLVSLKVLYCKTLCHRLISHVTSVHKHTLRELVWADRPLKYSLNSRVINRNEILHMNPFISLSWQCQLLERLVIHGYWVWQYDLLGFVRLCHSLEYLEVSSLYDRINPRPEAVRLLRVFIGDVQPHVSKQFVRDVNENTKFKWRPMNWSELPAGLRSRCSMDQRAKYIAREVNRALHN